MHNIVAKRSARVIIRPSIRWVLPKIAIAFAIAVFVEIFFEYMQLPSLEINPSILNRTFPIILPLSLLLLLVLLARPAILLQDALYTIGNHHLYSVTGRCSFHKKHVEVPFEDIRGVRFEQSVLERITGVGVITVWTATAESAAILMRGIANPESVTSVIRSRIDFARMKNNGTARTSQGQLSS